MLCCLGVRAADVIPPSPAKYFNDYANATSAATTARLNQTLEDFEKQTSSQIVVAVYPKMQSDSDVADYGVRVYRAWKIGQKDKNNGALLLVFVQDHKMNITTGYGLEGALPDIICKQIIDNEIAPRFRQGDFNGGLTAGVNAMIAATKGEYKGTGRTVAETKAYSKGVGELIPPFVGLIFFLVIIFIIIQSIKRGGGGRGGGGGWGNAAGWIIGSAMSGWDRSGGGSSGGGSWSGGGGGGGGGGFSGGGGSSGGGGASGSW